jgi:hypothetical protein
MHSELSEHLHNSGWSESRKRRMVTGLKVLQEIAQSGAQPVTYAEFAELVQHRLAPLATAAILEDVGRFCNSAGWPNVTCFVVSAATGECSEGFTKVSDESPAFARDAAWFTYAVYKNGPLVEADAP